MSPDGEDWLYQGNSYRVGSVAGAREVHHAVEAGVGCAIALVPVRVQLLLGEDVTAVLVSRSQLQCLSRRARGASRSARWVEGHD